MERKKMFDRTGKFLIFAILLGMALGVAFVAIFGEAGLYVKFLGDIFLRLLKLLVIPLLFFSIVVGISNLGDIRKLGRTGLKTIAYFLSTSTIAVIIGLVLVNIIRPGSGFSFGQVEQPDLLAGKEAYSFVDWLTQQIPENIFSAAAETQVLSIIIVALLFGGVLSTIGSKGRPVLALCDGINQVIMKAVRLVMWFAPIGIFGLIAGQLASVGGLSGFTSILSGLGWYSFVVILGLLIHGVIVLPLILKFVAGRSPLEFFTGMSQALATSFATASSSATLPVTMECIEEKNDVDRRASSFVLPLGATINMDGTALYEAVAALFIAQAYGIDMPILAQVTICVTAVLASIGAAGIPQAGLVTMILVLQAVGLPLEGIGMILAIDWFLDRCRTTVNVWGDSVGAAVIGTTAEIGLVDRRRKRVSDSRSSRGGRDQRNDSSRGRKQKPDSRAKKWDKKAPSDQKIQKSRNTSRRTEPVKKQEKNASNRGVRKIHKVEANSAAKDRDVYKPEKSTPVDQKPVAQEKKTSKPEKKAVAESKSNGKRNVKAGDAKKIQTDKSPDKKQTDKTPEKKQQKQKSKQSEQSFGRRKSKGDKVSKLDKPKTEPVDTPLKTKEEVVITQTETPFEIPKFPDSILDDLAAPAVEVESSTESLSAKFSDSESKSESTEADSDPDKSLLPDFVADESSVTSDESESKDFSKLDNAILGAMESLETDDSAEKTEEKQPSVKTPKPAKDIIEDVIPDTPEPTDNVQEIEPFSKLPDTSKVADSLGDKESVATKPDTKVSFDATESILASEDTSPVTKEDDSRTKPDMDSPIETGGTVSEEIVVESVEASLTTDNNLSDTGNGSSESKPEETKEIEEKEEEVESVEWGRGKRRKTNR